MTNINVDQFVAAINEWAGKRNADFKYYWPVKGGWEGWIQVDLVAFMLERMPTLEILREQPVFTNSRRKCDLLLNTDLDPDDQIVVELKAQSFENRNKYISELSDDLDKLVNMDAAYTNSTCVVVGIPFNPQTLQENLGLERDNHRIFLQIFQGEVAITVAVWTAKRGWINPYGGTAEKRPSLAGAGSGAGTGSGAAGAGFGQQSDFGKSSDFGKASDFGELATAGFGDAHASGFAGR